MKKNLLATIFLIGILLFSVSTIASPSDSSSSIYPSFQILGFHPYWMKDSYKHYNFSLLSMVAYLSYEVEPTTGNYKDLHQWDRSAIAEVAHAENPGCKVLLTITNFGEKNNSAFLNNQRAREKLIKNILYEIKTKKADGIIIDFEKLNPKDRFVFSEFIKEIRFAFQKENKSLTIGITLPAFDKKDSFDEATLSALSDWMIVMSYEREDSIIQRAGPIAPLKSSSR